MTGRWVSRWFAIRAAVAAWVCPEHERERRVFVRLCGQDAAECEALQFELNRQFGRTEEAQGLACEWQARAGEHLRRVELLESALAGTGRHAGALESQVRALGAALRAVESRAVGLATFYAAGSRALELRAVADIASEALDAHELGGGWPL